MDEQRPSTPLSSALRSLAWSPEQLIARVNQRRVSRGSFPYHAKSAYPWRRGESRPGADVIDDVLAVLSEHTGRPVTAADLGWAQPRQPRPRPLDTPGDASAEALLRHIQGEDAMERRSLLLLSGVAVTAPALDLYTAPAGALRAAAHGDHVSPRLLDCIDQAVRDVRGLDDAAGSASALRWAGGLWRNVARVITNSRYHAEHGRRLHASFLELSEAYGWMLFDANSQPQAQRVYQIGLRLAREADDHPDIHPATANLLATAAYQAAWLGQRREAVTLLSVARSRHPETLTPRVLAVIAEREILAAGLRADPDAVRRAVDDAHTHLAAADDHEPWWAQWLDHSAVDAGTGRAWLALRQPTQAEAYLAQRLSTLADADAYPRDRMLAGVDLATARQQAGDIPGAVEAAHLAVGLAHSITSQRVRRRLSALIEKLHAEHHACPQVRELVARHHTPV